MGTSLIEPRKNGARLERMPQKMRVFTQELLASDIWDQTAAAKKAGYKSPAQAASKLLKDKRVRALLGKEMREREERCQLKADNVLNYLKTALFFNPLSLFTPGEDGRLLIANPEDIPDEIGCLIEEIKEKKTIHQDGSETCQLEIKLISKTTALGLAMKHTTVDRVDEEKQDFWKTIFENLEKPQPDLVEEKIRQAALPNPLKKKTT